MLRPFLIVSLTSLLLLAAAGVVACGGDDDESAGGSTSPTSAAQPAPSATAASGQGGARVNVVDFGYSPNTLTARVGQPVSLIVTNTGALPHTFTITGLVDSGTIGAGQSRTVTFTPAAAGELQFLCTIHGAGSMSGKVTVTP